MVHPSACSCSCGWYQPDVDLAPADAWWKEAIRHETENRWYVRQLPGAWAATFGGSQVDALIKHQVEVPSDRSFRPYGRRVLAEPRESEEFKKAMIWVDEEVPEGRGLQDLGVPRGVAEGPGQLVKPTQTDERQLPQSPPWREPAPEAQATEPVAVTLATQPMEPCLASTGDATLRTEALRAVPSEVTCSKCGAMVPADANFCPNCGASMTKQPVQVAVEAKSKPSKPSKPSAKARSQKSGPGPQATAWPLEPSPSTGFESSRAASGAQRDAKFQATPSSDRCQAQAPPRPKAVHFQRPYLLGIVPTHLVARHACCGEGRMMANYFALPYQAPDATKTSRGFAAFGDGLNLCKISQCREH